MVTVISHPSVVAVNVVNWSGQGWMDTGRMDTGRVDTGGGGGSPFEIMGLV